MIVNVKSLQGDVYQVEVQNDQLVSNLKAAICDKAGELVGSDMPRLVYKGRTMHDSTPLSDYQLEDGCKIYLLPAKQSPEKPAAAATSSSLAGKPRPLSRSRFELLLRDRLLRHFEPATIDRIMANLEHEIQADVHSSSLDDLERLAEQKLRIN